MEKIAYRPLRKAPRLAPLITAIGMSIILQNVALMIWGRNYLTFPHASSSRRRYNIFGASMTDLQMIIVVLAALLMAGLVFIVQRTRLGMAMRATAQNPQVAGLMGIDINVVISAAFVIGAALAAVAGLMVMTYYGIAHYYMGFLLGLKAFTAAVLGGIGNLAGAMLGGILLGIIEALGAGYIGDVTNICGFPLAQRFAPAAMHRQRRTGQPVRQQLPGRVRVLRADPGAHLPPVRAAGRARRRSRMTAQCTGMQFARRPRRRDTRRRSWAGVALVALALRAAAVRRRRSRDRRGCASSISR